MPARAVAQVADTSPDHVWSRQSSSPFVDPAPLCPSPSPHVASLVLATRVPVRRPSYPLSVLPTTIPPSDVISYSRSSLLCWLDAHLDDRHRAPELPVDLDVALHDDGVGQKRDAVRAESKIDVRVRQLDRRHHRDAEPGQRAHHPVQRLAEILAERRRQRQLQARTANRSPRASRRCASPRPAAPAASRRSRDRAGAGRGPRASSRATSFSNSSPCGVVCR